MNTKILDFEVAHKSHFATALEEVKYAQKQTHWMWYIFPQIYGLGTSDNAKRYAICSLDEATVFAQHNTLGENIRNISCELLHLQGVTASQIFGDIDARKLQSSMTLFDAICPNSVFEQVLEKYFNGERDKLTLCRLNLNDRMVNALNYIGVEAKDFNIVSGMYSFQRTKPTHRFSHIYRVMIGTALIAHKIKESRLGLLAFIAAFIHDLARENDGHDPRHGRRAAETKLPKLTHLLSKYEITSEEYDIIAKASTYHSEQMRDRVTDECFKTCKILSDADALDRCRFKNREARLNVKYLYFTESRSCIAPIDFICKESVRQGKIDTEIPFEEFIKVAQF
jgi:uncharacterized protein (DUF1810 family)